MPKSRKVSRRRRKQRRVRKTIRRCIRGGDLFGNNAAGTVHIIQYNDTKSLDGNRDVCPITLDKFINGEDVALTDCGHIFNPEALHRHLNQSKESQFCPSCKKKLKMFNWFK